MKIHSQVKIIHPLYITELDNGIRIEVYGDYALGNDGKTYYHIGREEDDILRTVGWSSEVTKAVILEPTNSQHNQIEHELCL